MSQVIDNRVVSMEFDNSKFEKNVQTSMQTLNNLNKTIDGLPDTAGKGLSNLSKAAGNIDLSGISSGIEAINHKFSALGIAGQEVIREITRSAMQFGKNAWNMTFGQIKSGGKSRALNIAAAQFRIEGLGLNYDDYYDSIDKAVTGTAYGFDEAAVAASQFASSGVKAGEDMDHALRGISGMAAMTGRSYTDLASVMEDAAAAGKVTNDTFSRLAERGLPALQEYSKKTGKSVEDIQKAARKGTITFQEFANVMDEVYGEHATKADETFTGVTSNIRAALSRMGQTFYLPLIENNSALVKMLQSVKQKVKDLKEITDPFAKALADTVLDLAKRAKVLIDVFDMNKFKPIFDGLTNFIQTANVGLSFSNIVGGIKGITKALEPLRKAAKDAFSEVFPKKFDAGAAIYDFSKKIAKFGKYFKVSSDTVDKSKRIFKGAFSAISLGIKIFKDLLSALSPLTSKLKEFGAGAFDFAAKVGDFFTELNANYEVGKPFESLAKGIDNLKISLNGLSFGSAIDGIKQFVANVKESYELGGGGLTGVIRVFFDTICDGVVAIIGAIEKLTGLDLFTYTENIVDHICSVRDAVMDFVSNLDVLGTVKNIIDKVKTAFSNLWQALAPLRSAIKTILTPLWEAIKSIGEAIKEGLSSPGKALNLAAMMVLFEHLRLKALNLKWAFEDLKKFLGVASGKTKFDFLNNIDKTINALKGALNQLKQELKAKAILEIAGAIAILAVAFMLLASVDADKVMQASVAMGELLLGIGALLKEMDSMDSEGLAKGIGDSSKIGALSSAMIKIAAAVLVLAVAMKQLDGLENAVDDMLMIISLLAALSIVAIVFDKLNTKSFSKVATSMVIMAVAIKILASSMKYFDQLEWDDVVQGIVSIAAMIIMLSGAALFIDKFVGKGTFNKVAAGMVVMAVAVKLLASSVKTLGEMDSQDLADGLAALLGIMAGITLFGFALDKLMGSTDFVKIGAGFLLLGVSIRLIASAFKTLGEMDPDGITQAIMVLTFTLLGLTAIMVLANDAILKTGAGLLLVAAAMLVFSAAIGILGSMDIMTLIKGVGAMAAGLIVLGVALYFIQGSIGGAAALLIVAVALIPFALAMKMLTDLNLADLAGTILVLVVALAALTVVCYAMTGAIVGAAALLVLSVALLAFGAACAILTALPLGDLAATLLVVLAALIAFSVVSAILSVLAPAILVFSAAMVVFGAAMALVGGGVALFALGMEILSVSGAMGASALMLIGEALKKYGKVFLKSAAAILALGGALIVFDAALALAAVSITACAAALTLLAGSMLIFAAAAVTFSAALILVSTSLKVAIQNISEMLTKGKFKEMSSNAIDGIKEGFKEGISKVVGVIADLGKSAIDKIKSFFGSGANSEMGKAGANGVSGLISGIKSKLGDVAAMAKSLGSTFVSKLKGSLKIKSPSRVTMQIGEYVDEGLVIGIKKGESGVENAAEDLGDTTVDAMTSALSQVNDALNSDLEPTITPVMNLSEIQNGVRNINGLIDQDRAANISANYNANKMAEMDQLAYNQQQIASLGRQIDTLSKALLNQPTPEVNANVILQGDADGVFKLVRNSDRQYTKMHGKSAFA